MDSTLRDILHEYSQAMAAVVELREELAAAHRQAKTLNEQIEELRRQIDAHPDKTTGPMTTNGTWPFKDQGNGVYAVDYTEGVSQGAE